MGVGEHWPDLQGWLPTLGFFLERRWRIPMGGGKELGNCMRRRLVGREALIQLCMSSRPVEVTGTRQGSKYRRWPMQRRCCRCDREGRE